MSDPIEVIRARLLCLEQGYAVHVGCGGEVEVSDRTFCHRCDRTLRDGEECLYFDAPEREDYEEDVRALLKRLDELESGLLRARATNELVQKFRKIADTQLFLKECASCADQVVVSSISEGELTHCPTCGREISPIALRLKPGDVLGISYETLLGAFRSEDA